MFESHLDEPSINNTLSGLGQDPGSAPAVIENSKDLALPQLATTLGRYKPLITMVVIAAIAYAVLRAMKAKKVAPKITG